MPLHQIIIVNASSKNGTLVTHPTLHPPEMGIGSKCVSEDFQQLSFSNFQAFLRRGCTSFNPFLSNLDNSPHLTVTKVAFLLYVFTITMYHKAKSVQLCDIHALRIRLFKLFVVRVVGNVI